MNKEIKVGTGLGDIKFGCSKENLKTIMGEPSEIDSFSNSEDDEEYLTESWHYDAEEFSVSFDEEDNWKLTTIAVSSPDFTINGQQLIGKSMDEVLTALESENLGDNELDDLSDDNIDQKLISFINSSLNLWFEDNLLSEIQWGVLWSDEDSPIWPK